MWGFQQLLHFYIAALCVCPRLSKVNTLWFVVTSWWRVYSLLPKRSSSSFFMDTRPSSNQVRYSTTNSLLSVVMPRPGPCSWLSEQTCRKENVLILSSNSFCLFTDFVSYLLSRHNNVPWLLFLLSYFLYCDFIKLVMLLSWSSSIKMTISCFRTRTYHCEWTVCSFYLLLHQWRYYSSWFSFYCRYF
jgi:hypothetical protein